MGSGSAPWLRSWAVLQRQCGTTGAAGSPPALCSFTRWQGSPRGRRTAMKNLSLAQGPLLHGSPFHGLECCSLPCSRSRRRGKGLLLVFTCQTGNPRFNPTPKLPQVRVLAALLQKGLHSVPPFLSSLLLGNPALWFTGTRSKCCPAQAPLPCL